MSQKRETHKGKRIGNETALDADEITVGGYSVLTNNSTIATSPVTSTKGVYVLGDTASFDGSGNGKWNTGCFTGSQGRAGSYVLVKGLTASEFTGSWTIEMWFRATSTAQTTTIFSMFGFLYLDFTIGFVSSLMNTNWNVRNNSGSIINNVTGNGASGTWYHVGLSYSATNQAYYRCFDGTSWATSSTQLIQSDNLANYGLCLGCRYNSSGSPEFPDFTNSAACQISDLRISNTARYSAAGSYTIPTAAFTSDSNTVLINSLASSNLTSHELSPTTTSGYAVSLDSSGVNVITSVGLTRGSLTSVVGNLQTTNGAVVTQRDFRSLNAGWRQGCSDIFTTATISNALGCYTVASPGWTASGSTHIIPPVQFLMNTSGHRNVCGEFTIYCSDKATTGTAKAGILNCHYYNNFGSTVCTVLTIATSKSSTLTTFSVAATSSSAGITITTDSGMRCSWIFRGAI